MALTKRDLSSPPPFEVDTDDRVGADTAVLEHPAAEASKPAAPAAAASPSPAPAPAPAAQPAASAQPAAAVAVVAKSNTAVALSGLGKETLAKAAKNQIPTETLEGLQIGTFPRITINVAGFSKDVDTKLGEFIDFELLSWNYVWLAVAGAQNNPEADKLLRTSYDGINLKEGQGLVTDYIKQLKTDGYENASSKKYIELYANLTNSQKGGLVTVDDQVMVQISLSPQSVAQWERFLLESSIKSSKGVADSLHIRATQQSKTLNKNEFGLATFAFVK